MPSKPNKPTRGRKPRPKKPKDMPKRPLSAYNLFFKEERERILTAQREGEEQPDFVFPSEDELKSQEESGKKKAPVLFQALARCIGKRWKALPKDRVEAYEAQAKKEMDAYRQRMDQYQKAAVLNSTETGNTKSRTSKTGAESEDLGGTRANGEGDGSGQINLNGFGGGGLMMANPTQFGSIGLNPYGGHMNFLQSMQQFPPQMLTGSFIQQGANNLAATNVGSNNSANGSQQQTPQLAAAGGSIDPTFLNSMLQVSSQMQSPYGTAGMVGGAGMMSSFMQGPQQNNNVGTAGATSNMAMQQLPFTMGAQPGMGLQNFAGSVGGINGINTAAGRPQTANNGISANQEQTQVFATEQKPQLPDQAQNEISMAASNIPFPQQQQQGKATSNDEPSQTAAL